MSVEKSQDEVSRIVSKFLDDGLTQQEIGDEIGLSRARVQQILKAAGVDSKLGGAAKRTRMRVEEAQKRRELQDEKKAKKYGLTLEQYRNILEEHGDDLKDPESPFYRYLLYKHNQVSAHPDIPFHLTFLEWNDLWIQSNLERSKSNWMVRSDRSKPYEKDNMKIVPSNQAVREARQYEKSLREKAKK